MTAAGVEIAPLPKGAEDEALELTCRIFGLEFSYASAYWNAPPIRAQSRRWGLWHNGRLASVACLTPLEFGWGPAVGISGVGTAPEARRMGLAGMLLNAAAPDPDLPAMLFAHQPGLYEGLGFRVVDHIVKGTLSGGEAAEPAPSEEVRAAYGAWADASPHRLRRTPERWEAWEWTERRCPAAGGGYVGVERLFVREAVLDDPLDQWPVPEDMVWTGSETLTARLQPPLKRSWRELLVMTRAFPAVPEFFMSDQF